MSPAREPWYYRLLLPFAILQVVRRAAFFVLAPEDGPSSLQGGWLAVSIPLFFALAGTELLLLLMGLRRLGNGWRRAMRLLAFSSLLSGLILMIAPGLVKGHAALIAFGKADPAVRAQWWSTDTTPSTPSVPEAPAPRDPWRIPVELLLTLTLAALLHRFARHREEAEHQRARAEALRDQVLRAKLAPHFIFNTLNTLKAQIASDPGAAEATADRLAQLFRQVVQVADHPTIPLRQELAFVEAYLAIEQTRLGSRLRVEIDVPEALEDRPVPPLSLQVLVENAVKHGVAPYEAGGTVSVRARIHEEQLQLCVRDSGQGPGGEPGTGTALATLRERLAKPEDLTLERLEDGFRACFLWR